MAQSVEHVIGNDEVISSNLITSSKNPTQSGWIFLFYFKALSHIMVDKLQFIGEMHIAIASLREGGGAAGDGRRARDNEVKFVLL